MCLDGEMCVGRVTGVCEGEGLDPVIVRFHKKRMAFICGRGG